MPRDFLAILPATLATLCPLAAHANLVANPGFETVALSGSPPVLLPTGWTVAGTGIASDLIFPNTGTHDVSFSALTTNANPGVLSQTIATIPGTTYVLAFAVLDEGDFSGDLFKIHFGGFTTTITGDTAGQPGTLPSFYTAESFSVPAADITGASTQLSFEGLTDPSSGTEWNLDDVSVTALASPIPEPWSLSLFAGAVALFTPGMIATRRARRGA